MNTAWQIRNRSSADFPAFVSGFGAVASKRNGDGQACCVAGFQTCGPHDDPRPADLEVGDTAGWEARGGDMGDGGEHGHG